MFLISIVNTIREALYKLFGSLGVDIVFYVGIGFVILMAIFFFIRVKFSYESKLEKTADRLNEWLYKNQTINESNLIEFNNIMKDSKSPKILRKYWQQYMLYRDKAPSEYMSTYNCIEKPAKTNSLASNIKNFSITYVVTAVIAFFCSLFCVANVNTNSSISAIHLTQCSITTGIILILGTILTIALRSYQNFNIASLYQTFHVFNRSIDKASATIPKYVDFEALFTKKEIKDGIPLLGEYLEKRARQEQEELEEAQRNIIKHEEYDFSSCGIDGSLVLERAMKESAVFLNYKSRLDAEIRQFESEISTLQKNYENTTKDYERKLQASKESMEALRQQQEESTNRIEVNYLRKRQQDEVKKQEQLEREQEDSTNKFNTEVAALSREIEKRTAGIQEKKDAVQTGMLSQYQTFANKLYEQIKNDVNKEHETSLEQLNTENSQFAKAITYLKQEIDNKDAIIAEKDKTIAELVASVQNATPVVQNQEVQPETQSEQEDGHYDDKGYYWFNNGSYYDNNNLYHDTEGNVYDEEGNLLHTNMPVETEPKVEEVKEEVAPVVEESVPEQADVEEETAIENQEEQPVVETVEETVGPQETIEESTTEQSVEETANEVVEEQISEQPAVEPETKDVANEQTEEVVEQVQEQTEEPVNVEPVQEVQNISENEQKEEPKDESFESLFDMFESMLASNEQQQPEVVEETKDEQSEPKEEEAKVEQEPTLPEVPEEKPKRKVGRPRKIKTEEELNKPKRKVGRPRKEKTEEELNKPKRKVGRPRKEKTEEELKKPKRRVGRPRKEKEADKKDEELSILEQIGQSLIEASAKQKQQKKAAKPKQKIKKRKLTKITPGENN